MAERLNKNLGAEPFFGGARRDDEVAGWGIIRYLFNSFLRFLQLGYRLILFSKGGAWSGELALEGKKPKTRLQC